MARPKGALNAVSMTLKNRINLFIERNFEDLQKNYNQLEPMQKANFIRDLLPFVTAKMASQTSEVEIKNRLEVLSDAQLNKLIENVLNEVDE